jgi:phosphopantetheine adenylyltransferase
MNQKSTMYVLAEKTADLLAEKNTKIEQQAARIAELESMLETNNGLLSHLLVMVNDPNTTAIISSQLSNNSAALSKVQS